MSSAPTLHGTRGAEAENLGSPPHRAARTFDPWRDSTARSFVDVDLWGTCQHVYANVNLSIYSAQACNGGCEFCVEKLRPAVRGVELASQRLVEGDDRRYFASLTAVLEALRPVNPSVSLTGGEPSLDRRLPQLLRTLQAHGMRKRTMTTNGSGLLDMREGRTVLEWVTRTGIRHLNVSRAHPGDAANARLMRFDAAPDRHALVEIVCQARAGGTRPRLSCVLLRDGVADIAGILEYLAFATGLGADNVVFRRLMTAGPRRLETHATGSFDLPRGLAQAGHKPRPAPEVLTYSDRQRVALAPILAQLRSHPDFSFASRVRGYYYEVEVWRWRGVDVVFEEASLDWLDQSRRSWPGLLFELVFHPNAVLCSTWQPWDGALGPPRAFGPESCGDRQPLP